MAYLEAHQGDAKYLVAVEGANAATPLILASDQPVMAMGGFDGGDPAPTLEEFKDLVAAGKVRYVLIGGNGNLNRGADAAGPALGAAPGAYGRPPGDFVGAYPEGGVLGRPSRGDMQAIEQYVIQVGTAISADQYGGGSGGGTLYYLGD